MAKNLGWATGWVTQDDWMPMGVEASAGHSERPCQVGMRRRGSGGSSLLAFPFRPIGRRGERKIGGGLSNMWEGKAL